MNWTEIAAAFETGIQSTSSSGWIATVTAVIYVVLAAKEKIWCWPFGIISSVFSVAVYLESALPYEAALNVAYVFIGIYGWLKWKENKTAGEKKKTPIIRLDLKTGIILLLSGISGSALFSWISWHFQTSSFPVADATIAVFSIVATWMTAKKILENWLLWVLVDGAAIAVYILKGPALYLFAFLFILYTFMAVAGFFTWKRILRNQ